jgi:predicted  nucleic acid-binding Zn-ribbon protein|tara:strand:+ start:665 stop:928 length:264 start_codon:yes stop_codon:yes gene_type:complete
MDMSENEMQELKDAIVNLTHQIERMSDKQDSMITDVRQIKDAIYNPEQGLYARIRDLEQWQVGLSRTIWLIGSSLLALMVKTFYDLL